MDTFEYAFVSLILSAPIFVKDEEGKNKINNFGDPIVFIEVSLGITIFDSIENNSGIKNYEEFDLHDKIYRVIWHKRDGDTMGFPVESSYPITVMGPYLAKLGNEGWEVFDYQFSTEPAFGQALLKRKYSCF
jgi:hypothetical protein